jgi:hypothetical protein
MVLIVSLIRGSQNDFGPPDQLLRAFLSSDQLMQDFSLPLSEYDFFGSWSWHGFGSFMFG